MKMIYPEMPKTKLPELLPDDRRDFSTEEIVQIASQLYDGEAIDCSVPITPIITLTVCLDNKNSTKISTSLQVRNRKHMRRSLVFYTNRHSVQHACIAGRSPVDPPSLTMEDLVNIFGLGDSITWHLDGHSVSNDPNVMHGGW